LEGAAAALRAHAQTVRERLAEIRRIEAAVTDWFARTERTLAARAGDVMLAVGGTVRDLIHGDVPWGGWPYTPSSLPAAGSVDWLVAGEFFRAQGVL
jgi:hypothetical protein